MRDQNALWLTVLAVLACTRSAPPEGAASRKGPEAAGEFVEARQEMVRAQIASGWGRTRIDNDKVQKAMATVPRHWFVAEDQQSHAYSDRPLPIGHGQTISQPYIVALMTQAVEPAATDRVLEIGTGSGYQAAVLAELVAEVFTIEIVDELAEQARRRLKELGYVNVKVRSGDGYAGWPEHAPFDKIVVTAAPEEVPPALLEQLKVGGILVIPVGKQSEIQSLRQIRKIAAGEFETEILEAVRFVPMTGDALERE